MQPLDQQYQKTIWENCVLILDKKKDEQLTPYLNHLLRWLQDLNWPGAVTVLERLKKYQDIDSLVFAVCGCTRDAEMTEDRMWLMNLAEFLNIEIIKKAIPKKRIIY